MYVYIYIHTYILGAHLFHAGTQTQEPDGKLRLLTPWEESLQL